MSLWEFIYGPSPATIIHAQTVAINNMIRTATGRPITPSVNKYGDLLKGVDLFGNRHSMDDVGYCPCWQCPKWSGVEWWTPKRVYQKKPLSRKEIARC